MVFWVTLLAGYVWGLYALGMYILLDGWQYYLAVLPVSFLSGWFGYDLFKKALQKTELTHK